MAYQQNIPLASDKFLISSANIRGNFQALNSWMNVNHYLPGGINQGKHMFVSLPEQATPPATAASELALFTADGTGSVPQLFLRDELNGLIRELTGYTVGPYSNGGIAGIQGQTVLPSGVMIKWGNLTTNGAAGPSGITYAETPFNNVSPLQYAFIPFSTDTGFTYSSFTNTSFIVTPTAGVKSFWYIAIGV